MSLSLHHSIHVLIPFLLFDRTSQTYFCRQIFDISFLLDLPACAKGNLAFSEMGAFVDLSGGCLSMYILSNPIKAFVSKIIFPVTPVPRGSWYLHNFSM